MPDVTIRKPRIIDPGYRVPDTQPEDTICARVYIPNDILYIAAFWGHVFRLTQWLSWERGGTKARDAAEVWKAAYEQSRTAWENCEGECGIVDIRQSEETPCIIEKRINCDTWEDAVNMRLCVPRMRIRDGVLQQEVSEGVWEDAQDPGKPYDPRTDSYAPPPWESPPEGESGECLSAANVASYVNFVASAFADAMVDTLGFFQTLGVATTILSALLDLIPLTVLTAFISTLYQQTIDSWADVRDFDITSKLTELLVCKYNADGSMTESQFNELIDECNDWRDTLTDNDQRAKWAIAIGTMQLWGPVGMTIAGQIWGITTYECSYDACEWTHTFDFAESNGGWDTSTPFNGGGNYSLGEGWNHADVMESDGDYDRLVTIKREFPEATLTSISATFDFTAGNYYAAAYAFYWWSSESNVVVTMWPGQVIDGENTIRYDFPSPTLCDYIWTQIRASMQLTPVYSGYIRLKSITFTGLGINPFEE